MKTVRDILPIVTAGSARRLVRAAGHTALTIAIIGVIGGGLIVGGLAVGSADPAFAQAGPRQAAVAGAFYPRDPHQLETAVKLFVNDALPPAPQRPVAIIVPHAGYVYSGQIAADAYRQAAPHDYDVIVIVGVNHRTAGFYGISVYDGPGYETPLGTAEVDRQLAHALRDLDKDFVYRADVHAAEHSVEVQVPFVQTLWPDTPIVTAVVSGADSRLWLKFGQALASVFANRRALIVASSDLSHYPAHDTAVAVDHAVLKAVATVDGSEVMKTIARQEKHPGVDTCACGEGPMVATLTAARLMGAGHARVISYANSGDCAVGDWNRCVGYGAVAVTAGTADPDTRGLASPPVATADKPLTQHDQQVLLQLARKTIEQYLATGTTPLFRNPSPQLNRKQGAFVTLKSNGNLRGCIGHMGEDRPLGQIVGAMAIAAAFDDHRFTPLQPQELGLIEIEVSVLTPFEPIDSADEIVLGRDGVVIRKDHRSAVFLPQVATEQGWSRDEMLQALCRKAALPKDAWREGAQLLTFQADVFGEQE